MFYLTLIYKWEDIVALYCNYGYGIRMSDTNAGMFPNTVLVPRSEFPASHTGVSCITSTRGMFALLNGTPQMRMTRGRL